MKTPIGVMLEVGQKWKEMDPRFDRVVTVSNWTTGRVQLNGRTWAKLSRFDGKRGNYAPVKKIVETCPKCGMSDWTNIPESLAQFCSCGYVRVRKDAGGWEEGVSIQQWLRDVGERTREEKR
jgi:hypothetical protein